MSDTPTDEAARDRAEDECPFCERIDNGDFDAAHGDWPAVRFEPLNPVTDGHMLFVPRHHAEHPDSRAVRDAMGYATRYAATRGEAFNLITSSGPAATQTIPHIHVHYVPRREGDGLPLPWAREQTAPTVTPSVDDIARTILARFPSLGLQDAARIARGTGQ